MPTLRGQSKPAYDYDPCMAGRNSRVGGILPGTKPRKKQRRSARKKLDATAPEIVVEQAAVAAKPKPSIPSHPKIIRCSNFGLDRKTIYPGYFFCSGCDFWDEANCSGTSRATDPNSSRSIYLCTGHHRRLHHPTTELSKQPYYPSKMLPRILSTVDEVVELDLLYYSDRVRRTKTKRKKPPEVPLTNAQEEETPPPTIINLTIERILQAAPGLALAPTRTTNLTSERITQDRPKLTPPSTTRETTPTLETNTARARRPLPSIGANIPQSTTHPISPHIELNLDLIKVLDEARLQIKRLQVSERNLKDRVKRLQEKNDNELEEDLQSAIEAACMRLKLRGSSLPAEIVKAVFAAFDGLAKEALVSHVKKYLRETIYSPFNIARLMDLTGGILNLACIELLRCLETKGEKYYQGSLIPSTSAIQACFALVEQIGNIRIPYELLNLPSGECIKFHYQKLLLNVLKSFKLLEIAKVRRVSSGESIDGSNLDSYTNHTMGGLKMNDPAAINPLTDSLMFANDDTDEQSVLSNIQSRNNCFVFQLHIGPENTQMYTEHFKPMFDFFQSCATDGIPEEGIKPMKLTTEIDMSAAWKGLQRGGAAKVHTFPCHCCGVRSDDLHHPAHTTCDTCNNQPAGWHCYHHPIVTESVLEEKKESVSEMTTALQQQLAKIDQSMLTIEDPVTPEGSATRDESSIHFVPQGSDERRSFSHLVNSELQLRSKSVTGRMSERRELLRVELKKEWHYRRVVEEVKACKTPENAVFLLMQCIPCVLHMENRIGLKFLQLVLISGLSAAKENTLFSDQGGEGRRIAHMIQRVQTTMNQFVLGSEACPAQWRFPYDEKEKTLKPISLPNTKTRRVVNKMELLIEILVPHDQDITDRKLKWLRCIPKYRSAMEALRKKEDFTDDAIAQYQKDVDDWFHDWVAIHGADGMTNYIHLLGAGHVAEYLQRHRNLYRHSQQGWEAFNSLLKSVYFRRTGRGGGRGAVRTKLKPLARWLQRRVLWLCGLKEHELMPESIDIELLGSSIVEPILEAENEELENWNAGSDDVVDDLLLSLAASASVSI